jgi:hypothetical protein
MRRKKEKFSSPMLPNKIEGLLRISMGKHLDLVDPPAARLKIKITNRTKITEKHLNHLGMMKQRYPQNNNNNSNNIKAKASQDKSQMKV